MAENSAIEWCDHTFNPWTGCTKVSPGCDHCYAEGWAKRSGHVQWGDAPRRRTAKDTWDKPQKWNARAAAEGRRFRVFCSSLADVFDNQVPTEWRMDLFSLIADTPNLDWLLLTKRIGNVMSMCSGDSLMFDMICTRVWLGATIVNQEEADRDIPKLVAVPARVRFLSMEPLLGPVEFSNVTRRSDAVQQLGKRALAGIDWVIAGGESGPGARPAHHDWFRSLREQCAAVAVPFLFKQWGEWLPICQHSEEFTNSLYRSKVKAKPHEDQAVLDDIYGRRCTVPSLVVHNDGAALDILTPMAFAAGKQAMQTFRVGKKAAGRLLDGREHNEFPEVSP